jgi:hypothetical protein
MVFFTGAMARDGGPFRCFTFRWCLKQDTSLAVTSIRRTMPALSYILIDALPWRCFTQVPSTRVSNREPTSRVRFGVIRRPGTSRRGPPSVQHRLADELLVKWRQRRRGAEGQIGGVFHPLRRRKPGDDDGAIQPQPRLDLMHMVSCPAMTLPLPEGRPAGRCGTCNDRSWPEPTSSRPAPRRQRASTPPHPPRPAAFRRPRSSPACPEYSTDAPAED